MVFRTRVVGQGGPIEHRTISGRLEDVRFVPPESVRFEHALVERVDFSKARFGIFAAVGSRFAACDFRGVRFGSAGSFGSGSLQSVYIDCRFDGADLRKRWMVGNVRFERCTFDGARIHDWWADASEFIDCHFAGRITRSRFAGRPWGAWLEAGSLDPPRTRNDFNGNDFRDAELLDCSFVYGIDVDAQQWPDSHTYILLDRVGERIERVRRIVARWRDNKEREDALLILRIYSESGFDEQKKLFARRDTVGDSPVGRRVWQLLEAALP
jgi:uncharacterized protein YjbI with pentapeptide repeats